MRARRPAVWAGAALAVVAVVAGVWFIAGLAQSAIMAKRLTSVSPDAVAADPGLTRYAISEARPLFARNCAACHGEDMKGNPTIGAPNLTDDVWLYQDSGVGELERTILYGIRSGYDKSRNITDMPAFGLRGQLTSDQISEVVQYVLGKSGRPHDEEAAQLGRSVYFGKGECFDCHGGDAQGNQDYGAPDLTANVWDWGGDPRSLYDTIYYGRHAMMPAFINKLTLAQIRALAIYVHASAAPRRP